MRILSLVVRDHKGQLIYADTYGFVSEDPEKGKLEALRMLGVRLKKDAEDKQRARENETGN